MNERKKRRSNYKKKKKTEKERIKRLNGRSYDRVKCKEWAETSQKIKI